MKSLEASAFSVGLRVKNNGFEDACEACWTWGPIIGVDWPSSVKPIQ